MKLSESILLGSMLRPQIRNAFVVPAGSCALGAAGEALGFLASRDLNPYLKQWPWVATRSVECPVCRNGLISVAVAIMELNDRHEWTRPQIAEWVAEIEVSDGPSAREAAAAVS